MNEPSEQRLGDERDGLPQVTSSRIVYQGKVVNMRVDEIRLAENKTAVREVVDHPGAVVVAALDRDERIYLVRQYRHPITRYLLELPAGGLEPGEEPLAAAMRELREEAGLEAGSWRALGSFFSSPGFVNERLHAYLAEDLRQVASAPDDDEELRVVRYPLNELLSHIDRTPDAKTLATLLLLERSRKA